MNLRKRKLNSKARKPKNTIKKCKVVETDDKSEPKKIPLKTIFKRVRNGEDGSTIYIIKDANKIPKESDTTATDIPSNETRTCSQIPEFTNEDIADLIGGVDLSLFVDNCSLDDNAVYDVLALLHHQPASTPADPDLKTTVDIDNNLRADDIKSSSEMNKPPKTTLAPPSSNFLYGNPIESSSEMNTPHNPTATPPKNSLRVDQIKSSLEIYTPPNPTFAPSRYFLHRDQIESSSEMYTPPTATFTPSCYFLHGGPIQSYSQTNKIPRPTESPTNSLHGDQIGLYSEMNTPPPNPSVTPPNNFSHGDPTEPSPEMNIPQPNPTVTPPNNFSHGDPTEPSPEMNIPQPNPTVTPPNNFSHGDPTEPSPEMNIPQPNPTVTPPNNFSHGDPIEPSPEISTPSNPTVTICSSGTISNQFEIPVANSSFMTDQMVENEYPSTNNNSTPVKAITQERHRVVPTLPTKLLEEMLALQNIRPTYRLRTLSGSIYHCYAWIKHHQHAYGSGKSIKVATNAAALSLLDKLISIKYFGNAIGRLQEHCMSFSWPLPKYSDQLIACDQIKNEHVFIVACSVNHVSEFGQGRTKKMAKTFAAYKMLANLTGTV